MWAKLANFHHVVKQKAVEHDSNSSRVLKYVKNENKKELHTCQS